MPTDNVDKYASILKEKDKIIEEQNKLLAHRDRLSLLGESIENIAHQWKQPLSSISTSASGLQVQKMLEVLTDKVFDDELDNIITNVDYLSQTINDFKNFFNGDKYPKIFQIHEIINKVLVITKGNLKVRHITVNGDFSVSCFVKGFENELMQAIINIINNASDALLSVPPESRTIYVNLKTIEDWHYIHIEDTAGGIPEKIIDKIFNHYFTTKGDKGSGIGLYMTKLIVEKNLNGSLSVENTLNGAMFIIKLPVYKFIGE